MASTIKSPDEGARGRRLTIGLLLGGLLAQGLLCIEERAILMPWNPADHPLVTPTATAFLAHAAGDAGGPGASFAGGGIGGGDGGASAVGASGSAASSPARAGPGAIGAAIAIGGPPVLSPPGLPPPAAPRATADGADGAGPPIGGGAPIGLAAPVPETASWAMLILGFGLIGAAARARRRAGAGRVSRS